MRAWWFLVLWALWCSLVTLAGTGLDWTGLGRAGKEGGRRVRWEYNVVCALPGWAVC